MGLLLIQRPVKDIGRHESRFTISVIYRRNCIIDIITPCKNSIPHPLHSNLNGFIQCIGAVLHLYDDMRLLGASMHHQSGINNNNNINITSGGRISKRRAAVIA